MQRLTLPLFALLLGGAVQAQPASTPAEVHTRFAQALAARDLDGLVQLFHPDAVMLGPDGAAIRGRTAIREALRPLVETTPQIRTVSARVTQNGDWALGQSHWQLLAADGSVAAEGRAGELMRRNADGSWVYWVDSPYGQ